MFLLKHNTSSQIIPLGFYLDSIDGDTAETGLTIANTDLQVWKTGSTSLVDKNSGGATHMSIGVYQTTLDATDTNTLGAIKIYSHVTGALVVIFEGLIVPVATYNALITNGLNNLGGTAQTADHTAAIADVPTVTEFNARTILSSTYSTAANLATVDSNVDAILADTGVTLPAQIAGLNDLSFSDVWTGTLTESYAADGATMTPAQSLHMMWSDLRSPQQISTTWTDFRLDNTTEAMTFILDDATTPTKKTRET